MCIGTLNGLSNSNQSVTHIILVVINNGQIQAAQQRVVFLQPVQQPNGQVTYIQANSAQQIHTKPQPQQVILYFRDKSEVIIRFLFANPLSIM